MMPGPLRHCDDSRRTDTRALFVGDGCEDGVDTTLIPLETQYGATACNPDQRKPPRYNGFASLCTPLQRMTDLSSTQSLVPRLGVLRVWAGPSRWRR